ncbi:hypothetical protein EG329_010377 [Mollisiaceae sp. DMI_Dod_QoI]|nr:hypothetical protein EG329_010377 [Helotiales sp. DMI_Dod_QoI]
MSVFMPINPRPMLQNLVNEEVIIRLKWGQTEYKGRLVSIDSYMNIQLSGAEEWIDQEMTSVLGQVLIRYIMLLRTKVFCIEVVVLILRAGAITYYGFKARTRITGMVIQRWRDERFSVGANESLSREPKSHWYIKGKAFKRFRLVKASLRMGFDTRNSI